MAVAAAAAAAAAILTLLLMHGECFICFNVQRIQQAVQEVECCTLQQQEQRCFYMLLELQFRGCFLTRALVITMLLLMCVQADCACSGRSAALLAE
jgi:hypothetical protein